MATLLDELFRYVGFGPEDGARLIAASAALTPAFDSIVDRFYVAIDANPEARAVSAQPLAAASAARWVHPCNTTTRARAGFPAGASA